MKSLRTLMSKLKKRNLLILATALCLIVGYSLFYYWQSMNQVTTNTDIPPVKAEKNIVAEGIVLPEKYAILSASPGGRVAKVLVSDGEMVKAGQLLIQFDNKELLARNQSAKADITKTKASLDMNVAGSRSEEIAIKRGLVAQSEAVLDGAKKDYARIETLFDQGAVSRQELDQARTACRKAQGEFEQNQAELELAIAGQRQENINVAKAEVDIAQGKLQENVASLTNTEIRAPFDGFISYIDLRPGEYVKEGDVVIRMMNPEKWQIQTDDLTEINIDGVKEGSKAILTFDALPDVELTAKVVKIRAYGEKKKGDITYTVFLEPDSYDARLKWNMTATVSIIKD